MKRMDELNLRNVAGRVCYDLKAHRVLFPWIRKGEHCFACAALTPRDYAVVRASRMLEAHIDSIAGSVKIFTNAFVEPPSVVTAQEAKRWAWPPFDSTWIDYRSQASFLLVSLKDRPFEQSRLADQRAIVLIFGHEANRDWRKRFGSKYRSALWCAVLVGFMHESDRIRWGGEAVGVADMDLNELLTSEEQERHINDAISVWVQFCYTMNVVHNIRAERVAPAHRQPKHEHKYPKFEYRVLTVAKEKGAVSPKLEKQLRASPRQHLRRGHLRRYHSGLMTWIPPCIVGDAERGTIVHDYML